MKIANLRGRCCLVRDGGALDVAAASGGRFGPDTQSLYGDWDEFVSWAERAEGDVEPFTTADLLPPVPNPRQIFAIGMNYALHAAEAGVESPEHPPTFTKFPTCLAGPDVAVELASSTVDWEVELVVVLGRRAHLVASDGAWAHVAGLTVGQDLSDRVVQTRPPAPQFSLGKSFPRFGPLGPWVVTVDEVPNPDDLAIGCTLNGEEMQKARTSDLIFGVEALIHELSAITPLLPGDLIFTGTPSGVGMARTPPRFLANGDELISTIEGIGSLRTTFVARAE